MHYLSMSNPSSVSNPEPVITEFEICMLQLGGIDNHRTTPMHTASTFLEQVKFHLFFFRPSAW